MGFEGYYQLLCENGHYSVVDCDSLPANCHCAAPMVWYNVVNTTNGFSGPVHLEVLEDESIAVCPLCKHRRVVRPKRFKIPEYEGFKIDHLAYNDFDSGHDAMHDEQAFSEEFS